VRRFNIPKEYLVKNALRSFTIAEKAVFYFFVIVFLLSGLSLIYKVNKSYLVEVPLQGGSLTEGIVGNPRFINPVLALSDADKILSALIYSGLLEITPEGKTENDLAERVEISDNSLVYTVYLKDEIYFHDGEPITTEDIEFTIQKTQNILLKSPFYPDWAGIKMEKLDEKTIVFTLSKPYSPFLENLTMGILPKHIWKNVSDDEFSFSQYNSLPIGSGLYRINQVERNSGGIPDYYDLVPSSLLSKKEPYIEHLIFKFYPSQSELLEAYRNGDVESISSFSPDDAASLETQKTTILSSPLPRVFGVFFNQSQSKVLLDKNVREALELTAPKEAIAKDVFHDYAQVIDGPLPPGIFEWSGKRNSSLNPEERFLSAEKKLSENGWKKNEETGILEKKSKSGTLILSFSISTGDTPELRAVAERLRASWEKLGAKVEVLVFESGDLNQNVIRPRRFDALLFGEVVGRNVLIYPFWHSSERNDPGLNIALYANNRVDKLLENAQSAKTQKEREEYYKNFDQEIRKDTPAVFLYTPNFLYLVPKKVKGVNLEKISSSEDRFLGIKDWYIETHKVWKIFVK